MDMIDRFYEINELVLDYYHYLDEMYTKGPPLSARSYLSEKEIHCIQATVLMLLEKFERDFSKYIDDNFSNDE